MKKIQGIEKFATIYFVSAEKGALTPNDFRTKVDVMLKSGKGKVWVGSLTSYKDSFGNSIQGRQIERRAIVNNWNELWVQMILLLAEQRQEAEVFGEVGGVSLVNGLLIRPFLEEGAQPSANYEEIVLDCVGNNLLLAYPNKGDLGGSREYAIIENQLCYGD